jgi:hypothetical protein
MDYSITGLMDESIAGQADNSITGLMMRVLHDMRMTSLPEK